MYQIEFYTNAAANDANFTNPTRIVTNVIDQTMMSGDFYFAECSITDGIWTKAQAAEYLVSKSIGFIDLNLQEVLRQDLFSMFKLNLNS